MLGRVAEHGTLILWTYVNEGVLVVGDRRNTFRPFGKGFADDVQKVRQIGAFDVAAMAGNMQFVCQQMRWLRLGWLPLGLLSPGWQFDPTTLLAQWSIVPENKHWFEGKHFLSYFKPTFATHLAKAFSAETFAHLSPGANISWLTVFSLRDGEIQVSSLEAHQNDLGGFQTETLIWPRERARVVDMNGEGTIVEAVLQRQDGSWPRELVAPIQELIDPAKHRNLAEGLKLLATLIYLSHTYGQLYGKDTSVSRIFDAYLISPAGVRSIKSKCDSALFVSGQ